MCDFAYLATRLTKHTKFTAIFPEEAMCDTTVTAIFPFILEEVMCDFTFFDSFEKKKYKIVQSYGSKYYNTIA
jgi:hypothetical protein